MKLNNQSIVIVTIATILIVVGGYFFIPARSVYAAACNSSNLFLTTQGDIVWGDTPSGNLSDVMASPGSVVRLSVSGEDGCAGQTVTFRIVGGATFQGVLSLGRRLGTSGKYQLYYDWTNNLQNGTYKFGTTQPYSAGPSGNDLIITASQACNLARVYASPNGGIQGQTIQLMVDGQGSCQTWGATIAVWDAVNRRVVWNGSQQNFSSSNTLTWNYLLPSVTPGAGQGVYYVRGFIGGQSLQSGNFIVCVSQNSCSVGGPNPSPVTPGQNQNISWGIWNPLAGGNPNQDILGLIFMITTWILNIAGSLLVILIIYSGVRFMISKGNPGDIQKAREILKWALIGFAVTMIGKGFVFIIESVLRGNFPSFP